MATQPSVRVTWPGAPAEDAAVELPAGSVAELRRAVARHFGSALPSKVGRRLGPAAGKAARRELASATRVRPSQQDELPHPTSYEAVADPPKLHMGAGTPAGFSFPWVPRSPPPLGAPPRPAACLPAPPTPPRPPWQTPRRGPRVMSTATATAGRRRCRR